MDDQFLQPVLIPQQYPYTSPVTQYQQYGGPYAEYGNTVPCLSEQELRSLQMYDERNNIDAASAIRIDEAKMYHKLEVERWKAVWKKQLMDAREEYQRKRESMTTAVIFDSQGVLRREIRYAANDIRMTEPICKLHDFRATCFVSTGSKNRFIIRVAAEGLQRPILLLSSNLSPDVLKKLMCKQGISFRVPRKEKMNVLEDIISLIIQKAQIVEIPDSYGWCRMTSGWKFAHDFEHTFTGMWKEAGNAERN